MIYSRKRDRRGLALAVGVLALLAEGGEARLVASITPTERGCRIVFAGDADKHTVKLLALLDSP